MIDKWFNRMESLIRSKASKLIALLLAIITWYAIQPAISFETTINDVPIRVIVDPGWAVLEQSVTGVDVHFRGSREGIRYLRQEEMEVVVDVRGMAYDESLIVSLDQRSVRGPTGVRPLFIRPSEITLSVDQEEDRKFPVRVHIQGTPPDGYDIESVRPIPDVVTVSGPRQRLDTIEAIRTTPVDMEGRLQSFKLSVALVSPSRAWTARLEPERVDVDVSLVERSATRDIEERRVRLLFGSRLWSDVVVNPTHVDLQLVGRAELLELLEMRDVQVYVDLAGLEPGQEYEQPLKVHLPPQIRVGSIQPEKVLVRIGNHDESREKGNER